MTTLTTAASLTARPVTVPRAIRAEWTKLRTLRSTIATLATTVTLIVGVGAAVASFTVTRPPADTSHFDGLAASMMGVQLAAIAIGVLGVLLITGEYATGTIRTSLVAVPRRTPVLWAKTVAFAVTTFAVCLPAAAAAFLVAQSLLTAKDLDAALDATAVQAIVGGALYLVGIGLLGLALGTIIRNTAGGVAAVLGALFGLPILAGLLPSGAATSVSKFLPANAGTVVLNADPSADSLAPWVGMGVLFGLVAAVMVVAAWQLRRRDA